MRRWNRKIYLLIGSTIVQLLLMGILWIADPANNVIKGFVAILFLFSLMVVVFMVRELRVVYRTDHERLRELFALLGDGIVVMDPRRIIIFINPSAESLTGWKMGETIPYCLYCQTRTLRAGEERCLLAAEPYRHYFESQLPKKTGGAVDVGMSRSFLTPNRITNERDMVITIRDVTIAKQEEELRISRRLTHHAFEVREEERKRLSQDLHDGISQTLYGISLGMDHLARRMKEDTHAKRMEQLQQQIHACIDEVRVLSRSLYPTVLHEIGLLSALRTMAERLQTQRTLITVMTDLTSEDLISSASSVHLYRIAQEAVHNAIQHGQATIVMIALSDGAKNLLLRIEDNGCGFDASRTASEGYGLRNMEERARAIGGNFQVKSSPGDGVVIEVSVPRG